MRSADSLALLLAAGLVLAPRWAAAESFRCSRAGPNRGPSLQWDERELGFGIESGAAQSLGLSVTRFSEIAQAAFQAWEDVPCSDLDFDFEGVGPDYAPGFFDNRFNTNGIGFVEDWPYAREAIALTTTSFNVSSGGLLDADIELNGEYYAFVDGDAGCVEADEQMDVQNVLTHEVGHFLGLDHPPDTPSNASTTMYGSSVPCEILKRTLSDGDVQGLCTIYPAGMPTNSCYAPGTLGFEVVSEDDGLDGGCRSHGPVSGGPGGSGLGMLVAVGIIRSIGRPRRR